MKEQEHILWWNVLSEMKKWNLTINHLKHWSELNADEILVLYNKS